MSERRGSHPGKLKEAWHFVSSGERIHLSQHELDTFQNKLTFALLLVISFPVVSCAWTSLNPDMAYWVGLSGFWAAAGSVFWLLVGHAVLSVSSISRRDASLLLLIVPFMLLLAATHHQKFEALSASAQLGLRDCTAYPATERLELAWQDARSLFDNCVQLQVNLTGQPVAEVELVTALPRCPGYSKLLRSHPSELGYLQHLETTHHCSGWCRKHKALFGRTALEGDWVQDRCSLVAASYVQEVERTASQTLIYCTGSFLLLGAGFSLLDLS